MFVVGVVTHDGCARAPIGPQLLVLLGRVVADDRIGGIEDGLGRSVVARQRDDRGVRVVVLEVEDVADRRPAELVDGLGVVADHHDVAVLLGQQVDQVVLRPVGVLVLVDHEVLEPLLVVRQDVGEQLEDLHGLDDEVVEVQGVVGQQLLLVALVDLTDEFVRVAVGTVLVGLEVDQFVLGAADRVLDGSGRDAPVVDPEVLQDARQDPLAVLLVVDREAGPVAESAEFPSQDAHAGLVEGRHPHAVAESGPHERPDAAGHLASGLVREGDGQDGERVDVTVRG